MARLLIRNKNNIHPDPIKDQVEMFKQGDIVFVAEDDHVWGAAEQPPDFLHVDLPGPASNYRIYMEPQVEQLDMKIGSEFIMFKGFFMGLNEKINNRDDRRQLKQRRYRYNGTSIEDKEKFSGF